MSRPTPSPETETSPQANSPQRRALLISSIVGGTLLLLVAVVLIISLGLRGALFGEKTDGGTPTATIAPTASAQPLPTPSCETIISSGDVEVAVPLPISFTVGSRVFPIVPIVPEGQSWTYPSDQSGTAVWLCGTVVNYIVGLEPTPENEALLADLKRGDEIELRLSSGAELLFHIAEQREVAAGEENVLKQQKPGLTLILTKGDDTWQIATADYVAETEPIEPPSSGAGELGQPVRVGDVQVTVIEGYAARGGSGLPPGKMYYLIEFSVENTGDASLEANAFSMTLRDGRGNSYPLSPIASAAGEHGPLSGEIAPGATVTGTAGYQVPDPLPGPTLTWTFVPRPGSEMQAEVSIPYEAGVAPTAQARVTITDAFLGDAGGTLVIEGEVRNTGAEQLTVEQADINLSSSAGIAQLEMTAPPLPWTIQPGQSQVIELQYGRPEAQTALLELLGYSFEIDGLYTGK